MYDEKVIDDNSEVVVEPQAETTQDDKGLNNVVDYESDEGEVIDDESTEGVADPQEDIEGVQQTPQENAQYKKMRLRAEEEARKAIQQEYAEEKKRLDDLKLSVQQKQAEQKIMDEHLAPEKIYAYADEKGVSDAVARELLEGQAQNLILSEKTKVIENFKQLQNTKKQLKEDHPEYAILEKEIDETFEQHPDATPQDWENLFYHTLGRKAKELREQVKKNTEQRTIANVHDRARRRSIGSDGGEEDVVAPASMLTKEGLEMSNSFGIDPRKVAKYVKQTTKRKKG